MALDKETQQLVIQLRTRGVNLTKAQLKALNAQVGRSKAGMRAMGGAMMVAAVAVAAVGAALISAIKTGKEFEQSMANLKAISGAVGEEMYALERTARKLGATTKFTASEVGALQTEFAKLGFSVQEIQGATEATLDLAAATGADLKEAAEVAGQTVRAFGMSAQDTHIVTDIMADSFSKSALDMRKFTDSMTYVAPVAKMAGFSMKDTTAILGVMANAGIDGSMAGTALRQIMLELSNESSGLSEALGGNVTSLEELVPALQQLQEDGMGSEEMLKLVDKRAVSAFSVLLDGTDTLDKLGKAFDSSAGAAGRMADIQLDTLEGKLTELNSAWQGFGIAIYDHFEEPLKNATETLTGFLNSMTDAMDTGMEGFYREEKLQLNALTNNLIQNIDEERVRVGLIEKLRASYPKFLDDLETEAVTVEELTTRLALANKEYNKKVAMSILADENTEAMKREKAAVVGMANVGEDLAVSLGTIADAFGIQLDLTDSYEDQLNQVWNEMQSLDHYSNLLSSDQQHLNKIMEHTGKDIKNLQWYLNSYNNEVTIAWVLLQQYNKHAANLDEWTLKNVESQDALNKELVKYGYAIRNGILIPLSELENATPSAQGMQDYVVQAGDSLSSLSVKFGMTVEELKAQNEDLVKTWGESEGFEAGVTIKVGFELEPEDIISQQLQERRAKHSNAYMTSKGKEIMAINAQAEALSFLAEQEGQVMHLQEDGSMKAHQFTQDEINLIASKMEAGQTYYESLKETMEEQFPDGPPVIFSEEWAQLEAENLQASIDNAGQYVDAIGGMMSSLSGEAIKTAKKEASEKIKVYDEERKKKLDQLKKTQVYIRASDEDKVRMEEAIQQKFETMKAEEEAIANERIKKAFMVDQAAKIAGVAMDTAKAISGAIAASPLTGGMPFAAVAAAVGAVQAGIILQQKPPIMQQGGLIGGELHAGGGTPIIAERGEFIMNRQAVEDIGSEALDRMNTGDSGPNITLNISGNVLSDDFVADEIIPALSEAIRRGDVIE